MSSVTPSKWLTALGIVAVLILILFIMGFWYAIYMPNAILACVEPFTLMEILALILAIAGAYVLMNYLGRGSINDLFLIIFVAAIVIFTVSFYLLSISSYGGIC